MSPTLRHPAVLFVMSHFQAKFEAALAKYPATMDKVERWKSIAAAVETKNKKQCVNRFKFLREQILKQKQAAGKK